MHVIDTNGFFASDNISGETDREFFLLLRAWILALSSFNVLVEDYLD